MVLLVFESWILLLYIELTMRTRSFGALHRTVRQCRVCAVRQADRIASSELCHAADLACAL